MAAYTVAAADIGAYEKTLAANTEDTVTFGGGAADPTITDVGAVEIIHHGGAAPIYFRLGATATVAGGPCYMVTPGTAYPVSPSTSGDTDVHLISASTAVYSVVRAD